MGAVARKRKKWLTGVAAWSHSYQDYDSLMQLHDRGRRESKKKVAHQDYLMDYWVC